MLTPSERRHGEIRVFLSAQCLLLALGFLSGPALLARTRELASNPMVIAYIFKRNDLIQPGEIAARKTDAHQLCLRQSTGRPDRQRLHI